MDIYIYILYVSVTVPVPVLVPVPVSVCLCVYVCARLEIATMQVFTVGDLAGRIASSDTYARNSNSNHDVVQSLFSLSSLSSFCPSALSHWHVLSSVVFALGSEIPPMFRYAKNRLMA